MVRKYIDKQGCTRVCGGKHLKQSQSYPKGFGIAMKQLMDAHKPEFVEEACALSAMVDANFKADWAPKGAHDVWPDAKLNGVFRMLTSMH